MSARVLNTADAVVSVIQTWWNPTSPDAVERDYVPDVILNPDDPGVLTGRKVWIFPASHGAPEMVTRAELRRTDTIAFLVVERYTDAAGKVPAAWLDERVEFVQGLYDLIRDPNLDILDGTVVVRPVDPGSVEVVYDRDVLMEHRTFWSYGSVTYERVE